MGSVITLGSVSLFTVLLAGVPIYLAFLLLNGAGVLHLFGSSGLGLYASSIIESLTSLNMSTIPLFLLMGEILFRSGAVDVLFDAVDALIGKVRGRLYFFTVILSTIFGALCGSAVAVVAMLGRTVLPTMNTRGYDIRLSASMILGGASLAPIIPPSLVAVVIGSMANVSISSLLIAGIVPGLLLAVLMMGYVALRISRNPALAPVESEELKPRTPAWRALLKMVPFLLIIFSVMGLMLLGVATPSESAATGVVGSLLVAALYRRLGWKMLRDSVSAAARTSSMILMIVAASVLFGQLLAFTGVTSQAITWVSGLDVPPIAMFWLLMLVPFVLCMFLDQLAFLLVAIPLYAPIVSKLGLDPVWFWTQFSINMTVASLTPPFGYTMFALRAAASQHITLKEVFRASWPPTLIVIFGMVLMTVVPGLITWLPSFLR